MKKQSFLITFLIVFCCFTQFCESKSISYDKFDYQSSKISNTIYKSQIETAEIFIEIAKSTLTEVNLKLKGITLERNINSNNAKLVKHYDELIKREEKHAIRVSNGVKVAKKHLEDARKGKNVFFEIVKNYISFTENVDNIVGIIPKNVESENESLNDQIKAVEALVEFYKCKLKRTVDNLKSIEHEISKLTNPQRIETYKSNLEFYRSCIDSTKARVKLSETYVAATKNGIMIFPEIAKTLLSKSETFAQQNRFFIKITKTFIEKDRNKKIPDDYFLSKVLKLEKNHLKMYEKELQYVQKNLEHAKDNDALPEIIAILEAELDIAKLDITVFKLKLKQAKMLN
jgi:hypothetical protein